MRQHEHSADRVEEVARLASDPAALAQWEDERRIEDALDPASPPLALHARIMGRIASEPPPAWARRNAGARVRRVMPALGLAAAAALLVAITGIELRRARGGSNAAGAALTSLPSPPTVAIGDPIAWVGGSLPEDLAAEGRGMTRLAGSIVESAASPLRCLPVALDDQRGGESSTMERERSS